MYKKSCCRRPFDKEHGQRSQTLLKSARQLLYHISSSVRRKMSWKKSLLVMSKISAPFVKSLAADDKYSLLNMDNSTQPIQMELSMKQKHFRTFFSVFLKWRWTFEHFEKKNDPHSLCISEITDCKKTLLHKCIKGPVWEDPSPSNMVKGPRHCSNLNDSTIFIDQSEGNWVGKSLC